ncbi:hypothetical protein COU54_01890 [Candidatus Pacearchaeota archaeon CG10_big_fil_rev_8_21_14_0_10_31_24]|nr:MAG: hypothetical protein COU54_01890 [Candidatus Pacearchaeota archaeon CG10_big_fil_rev_8_21_14_0_10_31_24]
MKLKKMHWLGIGFGTASVIGAIALFFVGGKASNLSLFVLGLGIAVIALPFIADLVFANKREQEISTRFLEFTRNLAESVSTGTPISKSIVNMSRKNYGALSPSITKLANQIQMGIPVHRAFQTFAKDLESPIISRAVSLISEAERAGGEIDYILNSVSKSIAEVQKLKDERKATISSLVVQGYIIFFIFIIIMLVMEYKILPVATDVGSLSGIGLQETADGTSSSSGGDGDINYANLFLALLLAQGFFIGLVIGKLTEGSLKSGIKHSFIMMISAFMVSLGVRLVLT